MADLPITSDQGATPVVINDPVTTANVASVSATGDLHVQSKTEDGSGNAITSTSDSATSNQNLDVIRPDVMMSGSLGALNATVTGSQQDVGSLVFVVSGTWVGTIVAEGSGDNGTTFTLLSISTVPGGALSTAGITANGQYRVAVVGGYNQVRLRMSAYTSGSASVVMNLSGVVAYPLCFQPNALNFNATVTLGNSSGKSVVMKTGTLVTTATTVDQVVLTYTVTTGKTFYLEYVEIQGAQTTPAGGTGIILGTISLENPSGTKVISGRLIGGGAEQFGEMMIPFSEPIPVSSATVIRIVTTPAATSSMTWLANFGGYEK